jgi:hypothetical protein
MADGRTPRGTDEEGRTPVEPFGRVAAVRPFLVTAGRVAPTASGRPVPVETQVVATTEGLEALDRLSFEQHDIVAVCRQPQSIAEIAARLRLHLNVVRVLAEDLRAAGQLTVLCRTPTSRTTRPSCEGLSMASGHPRLPGGTPRHRLNRSPAARQRRRPYDRRCRSRW